MVRLAPISAALLLALPFTAFSQQPSAHVAFVEGAASLERESTVESLAAGVPLADGDRLRTTNGRLEIQFENGSTLYVDQSSTLDILAADSLRLLAGTVRFDVVGRRPSIVPLYRVDTPAASVAIDVSGEYRVAVSGEPAFTTVHVVRGTANLTADNGGTVLRTGEQSTVAAGELPSFPVRFNSARLDAFGQWIELRRGGRVLSVSQQYLPPVIQSYAGTLDRHGTWIRDAHFGVVWYPTIGGWRPYGSGHWTWIAPFGWTWIGTEAWAWPTLHYGQWCLSANGSWFWIPGSSWGPAAPITARHWAQVGQGRSERFFRDPPGVNGGGGRNGGVLIERAPSGVARGVSSGAIQHDPLARRHMSSIPQPSIGLPLPPMGLPPLPQGVAQTVPSVGTTPQMQFGSASAGPPIQPQSMAPRMAAPEPQVSPRTAPAHRFGSGWSAPSVGVPRDVTAPRAIAPIVPSTPGARPQFGTWGSIGAHGAAGVLGTPMAPPAAPPK